MNKLQGVMKISFNVCWDMLDSKKAFKTKIRY